MQSAAAFSSPGPLERTVVELARINQAAIFGRAREAKHRTVLRRTDALMGLVEQCREREMPLVPHRIWMLAVQLLHRVDTELRDDLGIDRHVDKVAECLFAAQALLMEQAHEHKSHLAPIIPLFGPATA